jgi:four helix bundle protein
MQKAVSGMQENKIVKFTDLNAWKEAHKLVLGVYKLTKTFPNDEQFALTSQMRRAVVSISSNIAEGFSRQTKADKLHFYTMAHGSLTEIQNQLLVSRDIGYAKAAEIQSLADQTVVTHKLLNGLMKALRAGKGVRS